MLTGGAILLILMGGFLGAGMFAGTVVIAVYGSQNTTGVTNVINSSIQSVGIEGSYGGATVDCTITHTHGLAVTESCTARSATSPAFESLTLNSTTPKLQLIDESSPNPSVEIGSTDDGEDDVIQWIYFNLLRQENLTLFAKTGKHGYYIHQIDDALTIGGTTTTGTAEDEITTTRDAITFTTEQLELRSPVKLTGVDDSTLNLQLDGTFGPHVEICTLGENDMYIVFDMVYRDSAWNATSSTSKGIGIHKVANALSISIAPLVDEGTEPTPVVVASFESTGLSLLDTFKVDTFGSDKFIVSSGTSMIEGPFNDAFSLDHPSTGAAELDFHVSGRRFGDQIKWIVCENAASTFTATSTALLSINTFLSDFRPPTVTVCGGGSILADGVAGTDADICITTTGVITMGIKTAGAQAVLTNGVEYNMGCLSVQFYKP
jgi:hypothetical protein